MKKIVLLTFIAVVLLCAIPAMALDTGCISIISNPSGAQIWIDGNLQDAVVTPHTFEGIDIGTHSVEVHLDNYIDAKNSNVVVDSGETTPVEFQLKPMPAADMKMYASTINAGESGPFDYEIYLSPIIESAEYKPFLWNLVVTWDPVYVVFDYFTGKCASKEIGTSSFSCEDVSTYHSFILGFFRGLQKPTYYDDGRLPKYDSTIINFVFTLLDSHHQEIAVIDKSMTLQYVPEYPSPYIPAISIIGFLGAVLIIRRTREK